MTSQILHTSSARLWRDRRLFAALGLALELGFASTTSGCGSDNESQLAGHAGQTPSAGSPSSNAGTTSTDQGGLGGSVDSSNVSAGEGGTSGEAGEAGEAGAAASALIGEQILTIKLALTTTAATGSVPASTTLLITARDGTVPVITDLWLYTLNGSKRTPLTGFTSTAARKNAQLMLPATINGQPSGLSPASDGTANGLMTNLTRGTLSQGAFVPTFNGTVTVTLTAVPTEAILVVAGVEDQRYAGAGVINVDGTPGVVPAGVGLPEQHVKRSYERDIAPLLHTNCTLMCHNANGPEGAAMYKMDSRDALVNDNFALTEQTADCQTKFPDGGQVLDACIQAINKAQFLVEPGAPAASDLLQRSRPDDAAATSTVGLDWYGSGTPKVRYNAKYGDRRMPSTTISLDPADWKDAPTAFDLDPAQFPILYDWVAQGALP
ncbi:MAG: hypothetical protein WDO69_05360 [Pseudomonadota bacterium]